MVCFQNAIGVADDSGKSGPAIAMPFVPVASLICLILILSINNCMLLALFTKRVQALVF